MIHKGVILAAGKGTRLRPATRVTNKHLLPVYDRPMIYYPIETLQKMGITEILIICGDDHAGDFAKLLGTGKEFGVHFSFRVQEGNGGIAEAISLAEPFAKGEKIAVILGDNIFDIDFSDAGAHFDTGAQVFIKPVHDPHRFGIAEVENGKVKTIEEKPKEPKSNLAVTGMYLFDEQVFDKIQNLSPSNRGELEVTDLLDMYRIEDNLHAYEIDGNWIDAGTHESFYEASGMVRKIFHNKKPLPEYEEIKPLIHSAIYIEKNSKKIKDSFLSYIHQKGYFNHHISIIFDGIQKEEEEKWKYFFEHEFENFSFHFHSFKKEKGPAKRYNEVFKTIESDFYFCLSSETILADPHTIEKLLQKSWDNKAGSFGGKIFQLCEGKKLQILESTGIIRGRGFSFYDRGTGESDRGQFDEDSEPLGFPIFAVLFRSKCFDRVEGFDDDFFDIKADIDISIRLRRAGYSARFSPDARFFHPNKYAAPRDFFKHLKYFFVRDKAFTIRGYQGQKKLLKKFLNEYRWQTRIFGKARFILQKITVQIITIIGK